MPNNEIRKRMKVEKNINRRDLNKITEIVWPCENNG